MSDIDLTEAVEAAYDETVLERTAVAYSGDESTEYFEALFRNALTAALPHIERQVREQMAREIEAETIPVTSFHSLTQTAHNRAIEHAASIARGDS